MISSNACLTIGTVLLLSTTASSKQLPCNGKSIPLPEYFGTKATSLTAEEVRGYSNPQPFDTAPVASEKKPQDFCNVTVTYTHPGQNDAINVYIWLPLEGWNGNFLAQGGGGWAAGSMDSLSGAVALGYAAATTDAGHTFLGDPIQAATDPSPWALSSPGNVNWQNLQNFAAVALDDMTHLSKSVIAAYYGKAPRYSYWNGCSTGGRQGMIQAQRYPGNYQGVLSIAPAINWATFLVTEMWAHIVMKREGYWPPPCEFEAIKEAAIEACDGLDGVVDGVVANHRACGFDAVSAAGRKCNCEGEERKVSKPAARIANAVWGGPERNGKKEWFGLTHETSLVSGMLGGLASTVCNEKNRDCKSAPFMISEGWIRYFLKKDPKYDFTTMTEDEFFSLLHQSRQQFTSVMGSDDPDLSAFKAAGGKMIHWHGLADELIFPNGSSNYFERVQKLDPKVNDFYRYFEAPGVKHCLGGPGYLPATALDSLVSWVEKGKAPEKLDAATVPMDEKDKVKHRPLCVYPKVAAYQGGDPNEASSFKCADGYGNKKAPLPAHGEL